MRDKRKPYQLGIIGGSIYSAVGRTHLIASKMDFRWEPVAGCFSRNREINEESASFYGIQENRTYNDWQELLQQEKDSVDAILIVSPIPNHYEMVRRTLELGIPVICEKALTDNVKDAQQIYELEKSNHGFLAITYNYTGYPMVRELRNMIKKGSFGQIISFVVEMPQETFLSVDSEGKPFTPQSWRLQDKEIPTMYLDLATHMHELIAYITDKTPQKVIAIENSYGHYQVIDNVMVLCEYEEGVNGSFWFSKSALGERNGLKIRINGTNQSAVWYQMNPEELVLCSANGVRRIVDRKNQDIVIASQQRYNRFKAGHPDGFLEAFANVYYDIADCLDQYREKGSWESEEVFGAEFAADGLKLLYAIHKSTKTRSWEPIK